MNDDCTVQNLRDRVSQLLETLESSSDSEPLRGADPLIARIEEAALDAGIRPPVSVAGRGMAQCVRMRSPFNEAMEDAGFGPAWKRLLGEQTYQAHAVQTREKLLYYLTLWRGWLAQPTPSRDAGCTP